jgi:hypothetical protein
VTLIAAFRQQETPVLVGDFLVTANGAERGSRKKICRIAENFAIGWTGNLVVAEKVVSELRNSLAGTKVSVADVEGLLTVKAPDSFGALHVHLIGWILGPPDGCFLWNSQWPQQLFEAPYHYDGTGGPSFIKQAGEGGGGSLPGVAGVRIVLYPVTLPMMNEITSRTNRAQGFGLRIRDPLRGRVEVRVSGRPDVDIRSGEVFRSGKTSRNSRGGSLLQLSSTWRALCPSVA